MRWKQVCVRDARVEFVVRVIRGEALSLLCREYEISRPTGYLWVRRFREQGVAGVEDRSRRPHRSPRQTASELEALEQTGTTGGEAVRKRLEGIFRGHGLPEAMLMDHGVPWWSARAAQGWTKLLVWLMKQGIHCHFSGIRHPRHRAR